MDATGLVTPPYVAGPLRLAPFRALMLAPGRVGNPTTGRAFARPYRDVAERLDRWERRGLATRAPSPALYLHEYTAGGMTVRGLVGTLDVSRRAAGPDERAVLPHEGIHPRQADDLAERMDLMQVNPAPILLVHRGSSVLRSTLSAVAATDPMTAFTDRSEQRHRIWAVREPEVLLLLEQEIGRSRALIADGHHRYAAYLRLQRRHCDAPAPRPTDGGLAMLVDHDDTPLFLGPIHRTFTGTRLDDLRDAAEYTGHRFTWTSQDDAVAALSSTSIATTDGTRWARIELPDGRRRPAVEILHRDIVPELRQGPTGIAYHHSVEGALTRTGSTEIALLLPAPQVDLVIAVAQADRLLPEKATSFQPKPSLGVLIRPWHDEPPALP